MSAVGLMPHRTAEKPQAPSYVTVSLGFLTRGNPLRAACIFLLESGWLDGFTLLVILVNCLFLALMEPTKGAKQGRNRLIAHSELPFTIIFTTEMLIKIIALGFFIGDRAAPGTEGPGIIPPSAPPEQRCTYLRDAWNILDFLVTVSSLLALLPQINDNVMVLRTIRVLRPLRTISALPGMQLLIKTLLAAIPMLGNVLVMCAFFFIVFGILGVQLFKGVLRYRCFVLDAKNNPLLFGEGTPPSYADQMCYRKHLAWAGYSCQPGEACLEYANPFQGVVSFDNFMWSALTLFQIIVNQGWSPIMYSTMDATTAWAFFYFVAVIFLGSWFLISLLLGVVVTAYDDAVNEKEAEAEAQPHPAQKPSGSKTTSGGASGSTTPHTEIKAFRRSGSQRNLMAYSTSMSSMPALVLKVKAPVQEEEEPYDDSSGLKGMCKGIISHPAFQPGIIVLILANTVVLAMAHNGMSDRFNRGLDTTNLVLSVCFAGEMVLKLLGLGLKQYFADRFNIFDMIIVVLSLVEIFMSSGGALGSLRTLRVLRVLRLIKNWTSLHRFVITIWHTLASLSSLIIILLICVFVYAVVGMQLFGGKLGPPGQVPRHNYDSFVWAAITSFQVITVDDWNSVLYDAIRATDPALGGAFFITLIIVGRWLILNLIIAILLSGLDKDHDYELAEQQGTSTLTQLREVVSRVVSLNAGSMQRRGSLKSLKSRDWDKSLARSQADLQTRQRALDAWDTVRYEFRQGRLKRPILARKGAAGVRLESLEGRSFCILPTTSRLRKAAFTLIDDRRFDMCVLVFIGLSSICLATETAHDGPDKLKWLLRLDYVWIIVFGVEMLLKMIALGVVHNRHSYFRSAWHWLDAMVVAMSLVTALLAQSNLRWVRAFRALRVLRPLRVIKAVPELQLVVNALLSSLPKLGNVVVVSLVFMVVYAILGMELFMGKMSSCSNSQCCTNAADEATCHDVRVKADCTGYLLDDDTSPCLWQNSQFNFDNFAQAMVTLFVAATGQGWTALMYSGIDAVGVDAQPQPNHRLVLALYFISYIVLGSFFCLNLFVGKHTLGCHALIT
ncbi:hypothetical protein WJX72_003272 [[Myrmecia] bisecta]|uniref:Ion transport domain-containing protein n=1 Tax=[Myrmecia] bisecta TaxID=41462 RepID=A0AAW1Q356_9CHLO